jgi:hypothetical protein
VNTLPAFVKAADEKLLYGRAVSCPYRIYQLKKNNVGQIIDLRNNISLAKIMEKLFCRLFGIKYVNCHYPHRLNVLPNESLFENINKIINAENTKTYLHCMKGKRRTGITVAYYEKENSSKTKEEILSNILNNGYKDLKPNTKKAKKYYAILDEFVNKYFSDIKRS